LALKARRRSGDWSAGYRLEAEPTQDNSAKLNQFNDNAIDPLGTLNIRHSYIYVNDPNYGELRLGLTATPIYNITKNTNVSDLEDSMHSDNRMMQSFFLRPTGFDNALGSSEACCSTLGIKPIFSGVSIATKVDAARRKSCRPMSLLAPNHDKRLGAFLPQPKPYRPTKVEPGTKNLSLPSQKIPHWTTCARASCR
jgi:hypothetical protein